MCNHTVIAINKNADTLVLIDTHDIYYEYNVQNYELLIKKRLIQDNNPKHFHSNACSVSKKLDVFVPYTSRVKSLLVNLYGRSVKKKTLSLHKYPVYTSCFNAEGTKLGIGGEDGKFLLYDTTHSYVESFFSIQADYISAIAFSPNGRFIALSSFSKKTTIYDMHKQNEYTSFKTKNAVEQILFIDDNDTMLLLSRDEFLYKYTLQTQELEESSFEIKGWASAAVQLQKSHSFIATRSKQLYLLNHKEFTLVQVVELDKSGVSSLFLDDALLYISFIDGEVRVVDTKAYEEEFVIHTSVHEFEEAKEYIHKNIFLSIHENVQVFHRGWKGELHKARKLLLQHKRLEAMHLVSPFFFDTQKQKEFQTCVKNYSAYKKLYKLIEQNQIIDAYRLCENLDFLQNTPEFELLEKEWMKTYKKAKLLLLGFDEEDTKKAIALLKPFQSLESKKELIDELITHAPKFETSDAYIRSKNFREYFLFVERNHFLKKEEMYTKIVQAGERSFAKLIRLEDDWSLPEALELAIALEAFLPMSESIIEAKNRIERKIQCDEIMQSNEKKKIYEYVENNPQCEVTKIFEEFHRDFIQKHLKVQQQYMKYTGGEVLDIFEEYLKITYTKKILASTMRKTYIYEIIQAKKLALDNVNWEDTMKCFYSFFGCHDDLKYALIDESFEELLLDDEIFYKLDGYKDLDFVRSVLVYYHT